MNRISGQNINTTEYWNGRHAAEPHLWDPMNIPDRIAGHLRHGQSLLDVGVGYGVVLRRLHAMVPGLRIMGCDFSPAAIARLRDDESLPFRFERLFVHDIRRDYRGAKPIADAVMATELLEHLDDPGAALANMAEMARGKVIISVPAAYAIPGPEHVWAFTISDVRSLLGRYGPVWAKHVRKGRNILGVAELCRS